MAFLEISGLKKRFGSLEILKGINLDLEKGGFLVLVGPSGCGKSTLLNTIAGLESITKGEIHINGRDVKNLHPSERDIAMVFQSYALYPNMTVALNNVVNTSTGVVEYNVNMAAAMIAALPTLLVYVLAGRYFVRGLMAGAVKG